MSDFEEASQTPEQLSLNGALLGGSTASYACIVFE